MCGIAGIVASSSRRHKGHLERMIRALRHRGPDGDGLSFFDQCGLGHTRLSIVDLKTGQQPMVSSVAPVAITFNGEIYGYQALKNGLPDYPFRTTSDTEVILAMYGQYGMDLLPRLPGMFAFAIWDDQKRELFCARDRFGEKPFYYAFGLNGEFLFASEIKALVASGLVHPVLDREAVAAYLQYLYVPANRTIFRNIFTLPPAHALLYREGRLEIRQYWHPPVGCKHISLSEAAEELRRLLESAVTRCLIADVPVGAFLSGGLDSSTVVAVASRHQRRLKTFCFEFGTAATESAFARDVAARYSTDHTELSAGVWRLSDLLLTMQEVFDEPFGDSSNIPTWLVARAARKRVKVMLGGDGGDELFGGYVAWYRPLWNMEHYSVGSSRFIHILLGLASQAGPWGEGLRKRLVARLEGVRYREKYGTLFDAHRAQRTYFSSDQLSELGFENIVRNSMSDAGRKDSLEGIFVADIEDYLAGDILTKIDRASMAHGLELRSPLLDVDLASFCIALPSSLKIDGERDRIVLRDAFARDWPPSVRARGKLGFGAPIHEWLKQEDLKELKEAHLNNPQQKLFSVLPFDRTRSFVVRDDYFTWVLLVLALWLETHDVALA
jgi:asparagine synthase (glutamine-hydrolysing)